MKKSLLLIFLGLFSTTLFAYVDSDMDGVEDAVDRCPNTPFMDLVDIRGCATKSLVSPHHFDIIVGGTYAESDYQTLTKTDTLSSTLQIDYYYKNFSIQASTSYYSTEGNGYSANGMNDSFIGASYQFKALDSLTLGLSAGALLPTYDAALKNNNIDYTAILNLSYAISGINIFGSYGYTQINDDNIDGVVTYQDSNAVSGGVGYNFTDKFYMSGAYNSSNSIYEGVIDIETASLYSYYAIDSHWFTTFSYAHGLSDSASKNFAAFRIGYFF